MSKLDELEKIDRDYLIPKEVALVLGTNPYTINVAVKQDIANGTNSLGFPVMLIGTRVRIPKLPFIRFMRQGIVEQEEVQP